MEHVRILPPVPVIQDTSMLLQCQHSAEVSNVFSNQMDLHPKCTKHHLPSSSQAPLMDSTLELETMVPVLTFNTFRSTTGLLTGELMVL